MMPTSPADPGSASVGTPAALEVPGTGLTELWLLALGLARFTPPTSPSNGSPHLKSTCRFQIQFCPLTEQPCAPSVT